MGQQAVIEIGAESILIAMKVAAPALVAVMLTGFLVSIFQAATQINEQTLSFIPKMIAMTAAIVFTGPWVIKILVIFTTNLFNRLPSITQ